MLLLLLLAVAAHGYQHHRHSFFPQALPSEDVCQGLANLPLPFIDTSKWITSLTIEGPQLSVYANRSEQIGELSFDNWTFDLQLNNWVKGYELEFLKTTVHWDVLENEEVAMNVRTPIQSVTSKGHDQVSFAIKNGLFRIANLSPFHQFMGKLIYKHGSLPYQFKGKADFKVKIRKGIMKGSVMCIPNVPFTKWVHFQGFGSFSSGKFDKDISLKSANATQGFIHTLKYHFTSPSNMLLRIYGKLSFNAIFGKQTVGKLEIQEFYIHPKQNNTLNAKLTLNSEKQDVMKLYLNNEPVQLEYHGNAKSVHNPYLKTVIEYLQLHGSVPGIDLKVFDSVKIGVFNPFNGKAAAFLNMKNSVSLKLAIQSVVGTILKDGNPIGHLNHTFATPHSLASLAPRHSSPKLTVRLIPSFALYKDLIFNWGLEADLSCRVNLLLDELPLTYSYDKKKLIAELSE